MLEGQPPSTENDRNKLNAVTCCAIRRSCPSRMDGAKLGRRHFIAPQGQILITSLIPTGRFHFYPPLPSPASAAWDFGLFCHKPHHLHDGWVQDWEQTFLNPGRRGQERPRRQHPGDSLQFKSCRNCLMDVRCRLSETNSCTSCPS